MVIHFTTETFKHEDGGYYANPGLVNRYNFLNEIITGCYLDIEGCFITNSLTLVETYDPTVSFHGPVVLTKDSDDDNTMVGFFDDFFNNKAYSIRLRGFFADPYGNGIIGKYISVIIYSATK